MKNRFFAIAAAGVLVLSSCASCGSVKSSAGAVREDHSAEADAFVDQYIEKARKNDSPEAVCEDVFTSEYIEQLKASGMWEQMVQVYGIIMNGYELDIENLKRTTQLDSKQLKGAKTAYASICGYSGKITDGYEYTFITVAEYGGRKHREPSTMCAILLEDEGWKVLRTSALSLESY